MRWLSASYWLRRVLERHLGEAEQDALGDLEQEFRDRVEPRSSRMRAEWWYVSEAFSLLVAVLGDRMGRRWRPDGTKAKTTDDTTWGGSMTGLGNDFAHALRGLAREFGTTVVIGLTLAVAVGATTAIFSVANAAFLRPLPYPAAERMVSVYTGTREDPEMAFSMSPADWRDLDGAESVEATGAWSMAENVHLTDSEQPLRLVAPRASAGLFEILGAEPALGRFFTAEEEIPGQDDAVVLSHGLWIRAFGADPRVIERSVLLDGRSYRIVGVAPESGMLPREADIWRPLALGPEWMEEGRFGWQFLGVVARLDPGTDIGTATRVLNTGLARLMPRRAGEGQMRVLRSLPDERSAESGPAILMLLVAVGSVLAMACANIVNVMLARSESRRREFGLRRALGSGALPLARLVLIETLLLAAVGAVGGLAVAHLGLRVLAAAELPSLAALTPIQLDVPVLLFGLLLTLTSAAVMGAAPLLGALRADPQVVLKATSTRGGNSRAANRLRDGLVVLQVALALILLVAVGLSATAFRTLVDRDPGFEPSGVLAATIELPAEGADRATFYRRLLERSGALPGVSSAGLVNFLPLEGLGWSSSIEVIDMDPSVTDPDPGGNMRAVSAGYFQTVEIPLLEGRAFTEMDGPGDPPVAVVDETLARQFWPRGSPVGRQVLIGGLSETPATIIGVVGDVPDVSLNRPGPGHVYFPVVQSPQRRMSLLLKTAGDPSALAPLARGVIRDLDPRVPILGISTFEARIGESLSGLRLGMLLLVAFGAAAALLAAVGIYGVLSYTVARRTREIGTRVALGAAPRTVLGSVVGHAMRLWAIGGTIGVLLSVFAGQTLARFVVGVEPGNPAAYLGAIVALGLIALLGATIPAGRATGVDPMEALRAD